MKKILSLLTVVFVLLTSCEKDITIDYHKIDPHYVVEASITDCGATATISRTINVQDTAWNEFVNNAVVVVTSDAGEQFSLSPSGKGVYKSADAKAVAGRTYTIKVKVGDYETSAVSVMQDKVEIDSAFFYKVHMMGADVICYRVNVKEDANGLNHYYTILYRNGKPYKWQINDNRGAVGTTSLDMWCYYDGEMENEKKDILEDGEVMTAEVRRIDESTYDYLLSLLLTEEANCNPIKCFTNGALGYFSAYSSATTSSQDYKKEDIGYFLSRNKR